MILYGFNYQKSGFANQIESVCNDNVSPLDKTTYTKVSNGGVVFQIA